MERRGNDRARELMFAALYLPDFELQAALRLEPELHEEPVGLLDDNHRATIMQRTQSAAAAGIHPGMTPSQGLARSLRLTIKSRARAQERIAGEILLHHAATLSPEIEATAPGVCTVRFSARQDWRGPLERVVRQLREVELRAQAGLAATPDLSFLAACLATPEAPVLAIKHPEKFLAPLPIEILSHLIR